MTGGPTGDRTVAGRYRPAEMLGRGGMGTVWRAYDTVLDRVVAMKELRVPDDLDDEERARRSARAMREVRAAALVSHPNVVGVHDVVEDDGRPWIIMELVVGRTLADDLDEGRLPARDAARITRQLLEALRAVHAASVVHRDVKPGNVLLSHDGRAVLTDFGIATLVGTTTITATGTTIGTLEYMAPERAQGLRPGPASDLWSLGATMYEMLEGRSPFRRNGEFATLQAVLDGTFDPPRHAGPLVGVLAGLLEPDPDRRLTADGALRMLAEAGFGGPDGCPEAAPAERVDEDADLPGPSGMPPEEAVTASAVEQTDWYASPNGDRGRPAPVGGPPPVPAVPPRVGAQVGARGTARRTRLMVSALALLLIAAAAGTGVKLVGDSWNDGSDEGRGASSAASGRAGDPADGDPDGLVDSAPKAGGGQGPADPVSTPPATPPGGTGSVTRPGYHRVADPGFSVLVPDGWSGPHTDGDRVFYRSPGNVTRLGLRLDPVDTSGDPCADLAAQDAGGTGSSATAAYPGYVRMQLAVSTHNGMPGCLWEFTWNDSGTPRRSVNLRYTDGVRMYDFWVSGPVSATVIVRGVFDAAKSSFTPTS
ncbi:serine/threonine-protein kinase [Streptodolium elevatio]|uniref:non-specific serine/threonine protein kinase n=1 Tax=Streptodolium elevatio TaxID=3157996 RepID=A0ABV3DJY7_9ACTN